MIFFELAKNGPFKKNAQNRQTPPFQNRAESSDTLYIAAAKLGELEGQKDLFLVEFMTFGTRSNFRPKIERVKIFFEK